MVLCRLVRYSDGRYLAGQFLAVQRSFAGMRRADVRFPPKGPWVLCGGQQQREPDNLIRFGRLPVLVAIG